MKRIAPIAICLILSAGCSKKDEECPPCLGALKKYQEAVGEVHTDRQEVGTASSILKASKTSNASVAAIKTAKMNLEVLPLTDEKLLEWRKTVITHFDKTVLLFNEWGTQLLLAVKTETMGSDFESQLEKGTSAIEAVCEQKVRHRRARRKQSRACKKMAPVLEALVFKDLVPTKIEAIKHDLEEVANGYDDFKTPVAQTNETLGGIKALLEQRAKIDQKIDSTRNAIERHRKAFEPLEKKVETYCAPK